MCSLHVMIHVLMFILICHYTDKKMIDHTKTISDWQWCDSCVLFFMNSQEYFVSEGECSCVLFVFFRLWQLKHPIIISDCLGDSLNPTNPHSHSCYQDISGCVTWSASASSVPHGSNYLCWHRFVYKEWLLFVTLCTIFSSFPVLCLWYCYDARNWWSIQVLSRTLCFWFPYYITL